MGFVWFAVGFGRAAGAGYAGISILYWWQYLTGGEQPAMIAALVFSAAAWLQLGIAKVQGEIAQELRR